MPIFLHYRPLFGSLASSPILYQILHWVKFFNLFAYAVICGIAIRIAPCRKCLFTCIALFPSAVLMAASYSYDPCVISFSLLGTALLLKMLISEEDISAKTFFAFLLSFAIGFAAKAIYFPLFGLRF